MYFSDAFKRFDPKTDTFHWDRLNEIAERARRILGQRTREKIEYAALVMEWILSDESISGIKPSDRATNSQAAPFSSPVGILRAQMHLFNIDDLVDFPRATWPEFFAAFALGLLAEASRASQTGVMQREYIEEEYFGDHRELETGPAQAFSDPDELALDALDAIWFSEVLQGKTPEIEKLAGANVAHKISVKNSNAAIKKHENTGRVIARFIEGYLSGDSAGKSVSAAAGHFYNALPQSDKALFKDKEAAALTLRRAIYDYRKRKPEALKRYGRYITSS